MGLVLVESPGVVIALGDLKRFPLHRKNVAQNVAQGLPLFRSCGFIKRDQRPFHLALGEISTQVSSDPELGSGEIGIAVMALIDFISVIELAVVFSLALLVMRGGMRVEIADAEMWTAACLDCGRIDRPVW